MTRIQTRPLLRTLSFGTNAVRLPSGRHHSNARSQINTAIEGLAPASAVPMTSYQKHILGIIQAGGQKKMDGPYLTFTNHPVSLRIVNKPPNTIKSIQMPQSTSPSPPQPSGKDSGQFAILIDPKQGDIATFESCLKNYDGWSIRLVVPATLPLLDLAQYCQVSPLPIRSLDLQAPSSKDGIGKDTRLTSDLSKMMMGLFHGITNFPLSPSSSISEPLLMLLAYWLDMPLTQTDTPVIPNMALLKEQLGEAKPLIPLIDSDVLKGSLVDAITAIHHASQSPEAPNGHPPGF